jgi:hypothetical protein
MAAALALLCAPAFADGIPVKDANGTTVNTASKTVTGVEHPLHVAEGENAGAPTPICVDGSGNLCGASTAANQTSANTKLDTLHTDIGTLIGDLAALATGANQTSANTKLDTLHTDLGTLISDLGALSTAANQTSANTKLDTLHADLGPLATAANQASANTKLDTLHADLGPLATAANQASANTKLDTLHADLIARGSTFAPAVTALSTTAAIVLTAGTFTSRIVCNDDASITEYIGGSNVTSGGANGVKLTAGQCWDVSHTTAAIYAVAASGTPNARGVQY